MVATVQANIHCCRTLIELTARLDDSGLPPNTKILSEAKISFQPFLKNLKNLPKSKHKELQNAKKDLEKVISNCIKASDIGDKYLDDATHGANEITLRMRVSTMVMYTSYAQSYNESLKKKLSLLSTMFD